MTPISAAIDATQARPQRDRGGGFTLMEVVLALTIASLLASLAVPYFRPGPGAAALKARANEIASLLRRDRNMALHLHRDSIVLIDTETGVVRSGLLGQSVSTSGEVELRLVPERSRGVTFSADGTSSGARIVLAARRGSVSIDVNRLTAAVRVLESDR